MLVVPRTGIDRVDAEIEKILPMIGPDEGSDLEITKRWGHEIKPDLHHARFGDSSDEDTRRNSVAKHQNADIARIEHKVEFRLVFADVILMEGDRVSEEFAI